MKTSKNFKDFLTRTCAYNSAFSMRFVFRVSKESKRNLLNEMKQKQTFLLLEIRRMIFFETESNRYDKVIW